MSSPFTEEQVQELRTALKRCSPATVAAAIRFRQTRDPKEVPAIVYGIIERHMPPESPKKLADADDSTELVQGLGVDSLTMLEIILSIEETLGISIDNEELRSIHTLGEVKNFIAHKLSSDGAGRNGTGKTVRHYNREDLVTILPQQPPFFFLDEATIDDKVVHAKYLVRGDEYFLEGHFKDHPVFPASIVFEALGQAGCLWILESAAAKDADAKTDVVFASMEEAHFHRRAKPGDLLEMTVEVDRVREPLAIFKGTVKCNGHRVAEVSRLMLAFGAGIANEAEKLVEARARAVEKPEPSRNGHVEVVKV
jgi:acyl carrier protein